MGFESENQLFLILFNPVAENFNQLISIEPYRNLNEIQKKYKKTKFELYMDGRKQPKWEIIGIRESRASAWALAMAYLKFYFRENQEALELFDSVLDTKNLTKIPIPEYSTISSKKGWQEK